MSIRDLRVPIKMWPDFDSECLDLLPYKKNFVLASNMIELWLFKILISEVEVKMEDEFKIEAIF